MPRVAQGFTPWPGPWICPSVQDYSISQYSYFVAFVTIWEKMKSPDSRTSGVFVPEIVATRLMVEPRI